MADPAVTFLLENVTQLLKSYVSLISGAENELQQLQHELGLLKAFLVKSAKYPKKEAPLKEWERQIREVVYDAEDTIDSCLTEAALAKNKNFIRRGMSSKRASLAKEVKSLREEKVKPMFDKAKMDFANMDVGEGSGKSAQEPMTKPKKPPLIRQDKVVGFEDEEETIINYLNKETDELDIISIIGMPGLGKTTLAWKIFHNQKIQYEFPTRIWVYVSQELNRNDVFINILKKFTSEDMSRLSDYELAGTVREYLEKGKFLLVMDDVWTVDAWNDIRDVLPMRNTTGKVLITSRDEKVGRHACLTRKPHKLRFLEEEESWKLLQLEVFGKLNECPQYLKGIGRCIAKQCDGLPLAVVVIGGILVDKYSPTGDTIETENEWKKVSGNVSTYVENDKENRISDIVGLSYNKLPDQLRDCFLYLGVFPEDHEIPAWTLTRLWIAEGFIQHKDAESLEETAEDHLKDLINRNLVMVDKMDHSGKVKTCRVHDVILQFCISKAAIGEQNLFQEIKMSKDGVFYPPVSNIQNYRRLSVHFHLKKFLTEKPNSKGVRSFLCFSKDSVTLEATYNSSIPDAFNLLRVLDSKSFKFIQFPTKVTKLFHLRYITLSCDNLSMIPEAISDLWNLQTLVVDTKSRTLQIKANIWKMIQLRHLKTKASIILPIKGDGNAGENLQTLSRLSPEDCKEGVFKRARNLKRLGICGSLASHLDFKSLQKLNHLENLKLVNDLIHESASENPLCGLPPSNSFPPNLKRLTLSATCLDWNQMSTLGMIGTLQVLKCKDNAFTGQTWTAVGGFRSLQLLLIERTDLVFWEASGDPFPNLRYLVLKNCEKLIEIPLDLGRNLQKLDIERVPKSVVRSAKKIEEMHGHQKARGDGFKLSMGPECVS